MSEKGDVCCAERGDVVFQVLREVRDPTYQDQYFVDAGCIARDSASSVLDIQWLKNSEPINASHYVPSPFPLSFII